LAGALSADLTAVCTGYQYAR